MLLDVFFKVLNFSYGQRKGGALNKFHPLRSGIKLLKKTHKKTPPKLSYLKVKVTQQKEANSEIFRCKP